MSDRNQGGGPLRISMTLPGSASLGAFQAGAVAALSIMVTRLRRRGVDVRVDALGGSSAGSIVAMLFAHCLLTGRDTPTVLCDAWVDEVDVELMRCGGGEAPLAFDDLHRELVDFLTDTDDHPLGVHDPLPDPVTIEVGLTSLLGLSIAAETRNGTIPTLTFADRKVFELATEHDPAVLTEPAGLLETVLASASHPIAFRASRIDRSDDREAMAERGIDNLPDDARLWYTDGGLVESTPVRRIIDAAARRAGSDRGTHVHLVVDPRSSGPSGDERWADASFEPSWLAGLRRAISIVPTQALHDDLRSVLSENRRIEAIDELLDDLADRLGSDDDGRAELRDRLLDVAGIQDDAIVGIEMITPLRFASDLDEQGVSDLLAGDFVGAFGGFLDERIRQSDFALGWLCARSWIEGQLGAFGVDDEAIEEIVVAIDESDLVDREDHDRDGDGVDQLDRTGRWQLALLAAQFGRVVAGEAVPWHPVEKVRAALGRSR